MVIFDSYMSLPEGKWGTQSIPHLWKKSLLYMSKYGISLVLATLAPFLQGEASQL